MKSIIKLIFRKIGVDFSIYPSRDIQRRLNILKKFSINHVLDIGANSGQYSSELFDLGYCGKISSFEPLSKAFQELEVKSRGMSNWFAYNYALGSENNTSLIHISQNSVSSSLSDMLESHLVNAPESVVIKSEEIRVINAGDALAECCNISEENIYVKIDTQGYERYVLDGLVNYKDSISAIQLEISLTPLYEDGLSLTDAIEYLDSWGFDLFSIENGFHDLNNVRLLQADLIFVKRS